MRISRFAWCVLFCALFAAPCAVPCIAQDANNDLPKFKQWLQPQEWKRDSDQPILSLGAKGQFDDTHIFGPCVIFENGEYSLYYSGSQGHEGLRNRYNGNRRMTLEQIDALLAQGTSARDGYGPIVQRERLFKLGLAKSKDGINFEKVNNGEPVFEFGDGVHSIVTATILRNPDGSVLRENGKLRMWFTAVDFPGSYAHNIHEATSEDGIHWSKPSEPLLKNAYAPTIIKDGDKYKMWFCLPAKHPWHIAYAESTDGKNWKVHETPSIQIDQAWEKKDLVYPTVVKIDDVYLMIYGGYWNDPFYTAMGWAVSDDGVHWTKNPNNPVFKPNPKNEWESNYTTSQSWMRLPDGSFRLWYASRTAPPWTNLYFAIGTAHWDGPEKKSDSKKLGQ